jgi:hypothetical protein
MHPYITQGLITARTADRHQAAAATRQARQARQAAGRPGFLSLGRRPFRRAAQPAMPAAYRAMSR